LCAPFLWSLGEALFDSNKSIQANKKLRLFGKYAIYRDAPPRRVDGRRRPVPARPDGPAGEARRALRRDRGWCRRAARADWVWQQDAAAWIELEHLGLCLQGDPCGAHARLYEIFMAPRDG